MHVDGAFGAFFRLWEPREARCGHGARRLARGRCPQVAERAERAGFALLRDAQLHRETFAGSAAYLTPGAGRPPRARHRGQPLVAGRCVWAALKQLGREGVAEMVSRCCELAQELAAWSRNRTRLELTAPHRPTSCASATGPGWQRRRRARRAQPADPGRGQRGRGRLPHGRPSSPAASASARPSSPGARRRPMSTHSATRSSKPACGWRSRERQREKTVSSSSTTVEAVDRLAAERASRRLREPAHRRDVTRVGGGDRLTAVAHDGPLQGPPGCGQLRDDRRHGLALTRE